MSVPVTNAFIPSIAPVEENAQQLPKKVSQRYILFISSDQCIDKTLKSRKLNILIS